MNCLYKEGHESHSHLCPHSIQLREVNLSLLVRRVAKTFSIHTALDDGHIFHFCALPPNAAQQSIAVFSTCRHVKKEGNRYKICIAKGSLRKVSGQATYTATPIKKISIAKQTTTRFVESIATARAPARKATIAVAIMNRRLIIYTYHKVKLQASCFMSTFSTRIFSMTWKRALSE